MFRKVLPCVLLLATASYADGLKSIDNFLQNKTSMISAGFKQTVFGVRKNTVSTGTMEISRPNKFLWQYQNTNGTPGQLILSDGKMIYIYDKDLAQVTEKKLTKSLDRSPALLLAGGSDLKSIYNVKNISSTDGLDWVSLTPKNPDDNNGFKQVDMAFTKAGTLARMKFTDSFDNKSKIEFTNVNTGVVIPTTHFVFVAPKGTDVISSN